MIERFPGAVPEIPVSNVRSAISYYETSLGFIREWVSTEYGIAGISRGDCRLYLTDAPFRQGYANTAPIVVWLNLKSRAEVDALHGAWKQAQARVSSAPQPEPWNLYEFTATDLDGNVFRVFSSLTDET
jgi:uncharacterized glyoxalase superfamily protein PhnB